MTNIALHYLVRPSPPRRQFPIGITSYRNKSIANPQLKSRIVKFRVPRSEKKDQVGLQVSDRSTTWKTVRKLLPHNEVSDDTVNKHEACVLNAFGLHRSDVLIIPLPQDIPSPFTYHSTVNEDMSYIDQPRLSVTKLLTHAWCELRTFYEVYAGLPRTGPLESMKIGTVYHERLEVEAHPKREVVTLKTQIRNLLKKFSPEARDALVKTRVNFSFAQIWIEQTVLRSICASRTKVAREIFLHGFLDLELESLVTDRNRLGDGVLVNGIADIVKIDTFDASTPLTNTSEDMVGSLAEKSPTKFLTEVLDLNTELLKAKEIMTHLACDHFLHIRDVKTRNTNNIPNQRLVLTAAKFQCMYYAMFLYNLSRDAGFAYQSCLQNLKTRKLDPDEPISIALATELIIVNFRTIAIDCVRLAKGEALGFHEFDEQVHKLSQYSLKYFITEKEFRSLMKVHYHDELDIDAFDLSPLFADWKIPLTLRYVCARAGQAFNIYQAFEPSSVCVEYHNPQKQQVIARMHYPFSTSEFEHIVSQSCQFWNGARKPVSTSDISKCNHCTFKNRCATMNSGFGPEAARLIHQLQK